MFEYIKGILVSLSPDKAVVDVGGIGFALFTPFSLFSVSPPLGKELLLYVSSIIREDSHRNYGFTSEEERDLFNIIHSISGVGPKTALALVSHFDGLQLEAAIAGGNAAVLATLPGIGKKTAERLIVELQDRLLKRRKQAPLPSLAPKGKGGEGDSTISDACAALINLGYSALQAQQAIKKALTQFNEEPPSLSPLIKAALALRQPSS